MKNDIYFPTPIEVSDFILDSFIHKELKPHLYGEVTPAYMLVFRYIDEMKKLSSPDVIQHAQENALFDYVPYAQSVIVAEPGEVMVEQVREEAIKMLLYMKHLENCVDESVKKQAMKNSIHNLPEYIKGKLNNDK